MVVTTTSRKSPNHDGLEGVGKRMPVARLKRCSGCGDSNPRGDFSTDNKQPDGKCRQCKKCVHENYVAHRNARIAAARDYALANREHVKERHHKLYVEQREERIRKATEYHVEHRDARRSKMKAYGKAHKEELVERSRKWRKANPERSRECKRRRLESDPEKRKQQNESNRKWAHANPAAVRLGTSTREVRDRLAGAGRFVLQEWEDLKDQFDHRCACCDKHESETPEGKLQSDHIVPLSSLRDVPFPITKEQSELNLITNIQPLCKTCNLQKGTKTTDFRKEALKRCAARRQNVQTV